MLKFLGAMLLLVLAMYGAACLWLFVAQRSFIYYPPPAALLPAPRVSTLDVPGARLRISERPVPGAKALLYLGGNAEDVSASLPLLAQAFPDRSLFLLHYRGYAGSTGAPAEAALAADALALFDRIAAGYPDIVVLGRSLGSGVALQVASRRRPRALVLVTPFDSLQDMAARQFPWFPVRLLLKDKYESWRYARQVTAPTLVIAAEHDRIVPAWSTDLLLSRFPVGVATGTTIAGSGHNDISENPAYLAALRRID